jgi:potassium efflux system protein
MTRVASTVLGLVLALALLPGAAAQDTSPVPPANGAAATPAASPRPIALEDIPARADTDERYADEVLVRSTQDLPIQRSAEPELRAIEQSVDAKGGMFAYAELRRLPVLRLESLERHWKFDALRFSHWKQELRASTDPYARDAAELSGRRALWEATRRAYPPGSLPEALSQRIDTVIARLRQAENSLSSPLQQQMELGRRANLLDARIRSGAHAVAAAIEHIDRRLLRIDAPPLWTTSASAAVNDSMRQVLRKELALELEFMRQYAEAGLGNQRALRALEIVLVPLLGWLAWSTRRTPQVDATTAASAHVLLRPVSCWVLLSMIGVMVLEPDAPLLLHQITMVVALIPVLRLLPAPARALLGPWPYLASGFYLLQRLGFFLLANHPLYRWYYLLLAATMLLLTLWLLRLARRHTAHASASVRTTARALAWTAVALLSGSVVSNVLGNVSMAVMLAGGIIDCGYMALVLYAALAVFSALLRTLLAQPGLHHLRLLQAHRESLADGIIRVMRLGTAAGWLVFAMERFRVFRPLWSLAQSALTRRLEYGELSLSLGDVLVFFVSVFLAFWIARSLRLVLQEEVLARMSLPRGVGNSVASLSYYALLLIGLLLALSAAGFKVGQLTFLFGALGVGIGLGLQGVVNNFVSGLILMFERPLQPGDVIDFDGTSGRVHNIGMRATTLKTFEGADVVIPNGMLLSEKLTNWTLLDSSRRLSVDVGVAYGSDVAQVQALLSQAVSDTAHVAKFPPPSVFFLGFGASALDFSVRAWTHDADNWMGVRSALVANLHAALSQAQIEIPFPQQDLHLRSVDKTAAEALFRQATGTGHPAGTDTPPA